MTEDELTEAARALRDNNQLTAPLHVALKSVAAAFVRYGRFPAALSPYGVWNDEAIDEVFQGWLAERLLVEGQLLAILDRAANPGAFRRIAERSLRQHMLTASQRSQSQNLYRRMFELLDERTDLFFRSVSSRRHQDVVWALRAKPEEHLFQGSDRQLLSLAWSLGAFELVHYKTSSRKLSPLLSTADLERFVVGMIEAAGPMSLAQLTKALELRFELGAVDYASLDDPERPLEVAATDSVEDDSILRAQAIAVIATLSKRQVDVLLGRRAEQTWDALAQILDCSPATIANEEKAIAAAMNRFSENQHEAFELLRIVGDLLYEQSGA